MYRVVSNALATYEATVSQSAEQRVLELEDVLRFIASRKVMDGVTAMRMQSIAKASLLRRTRCLS